MIHSPYIYSYLERIILVTVKPTTDEQTCIYLQMNMISSFLNYQFALEQAHSERKKGILRSRAIQVIKGGTNEMVLLFTSFPLEHLIQFTEQASDFFSLFSAWMRSN